MADDCGKNRILKWFKEIDTSLTYQRQNLEQLCDSLKSLTSKQKRIKLTSENVDEYSTSSDVSYEAERKDEAVDFGEIDKVLEKAKSLRIIDNETALQQCSSIETPKSSVTGVKIRGQRSQKASQVIRNPVRPTTQSRLEAAGKRPVLMSRPSQKSKQMISSKELQAFKKKPASSRSAFDIRSERSRTATKIRSSLPRGEKSVDSTTRQIDTPIGDKRTIATERDVIAEQDMKETVTVSRDAIDCCMKIRNLREKIANVVKNPSREILQAKTEFLIAVENSFSDVSSFSHPVLGSESEEICSFRKAVTSKLKDVSLSLESLSSIKPQDTYYVSTEQLQRLCSKILKLQEMMIELEGKEILHQWSLNLLQSDHLTKSEKINVFRKLHGLLIFNGKILPAMIQDSEPIEYEDDAP